MKENVFKQYSSERGNWLKRGRMDLAETIIEKVHKKGVTWEILEIGPGVGQNILSLKRFGEVDVIESHPLGITALQKIPEIRNLYPKSAPFELKRTYDLICAFDVLEHIEDDTEMIHWVSEHLKHNGYFFIVVPAYQWLFSNHDIALGHFRRYTTSDLKRKFGSDFRLAELGYFNSLLFPIPVTSRLINRYFFGNRDKMDQKKDSSLLPHFLDRIFGNILSFEASLISNNYYLPFGLSAYCLGQLISKNGLAPKESE